MRKKLLVLVATVATMLAMAAPAMAYPHQINTGSAAAQNNNATLQINAAEQQNKQVALFGSNYSNQELNQSNYNETNQLAAAVAGNFAF